MAISQASKRLICPDLLLFIYMICYGPIRTAVCQSVTSPQPAECENFDVRLVNGSSKMEGRLELCANGYWSNVCNDYRARAAGLDAYSLWTKYAARLVCRKLGFPTEVALHNYDGSPYGSNPLLPSVTVDCGLGYYPYDPVVDDIAADCRIINFCSPERSIVGISCGEKTYYKATVEVFPAQESYEIGTQVTVRCMPPPSLHWRSPRILWRSTSFTRFYYGSNFTFVIPSHSPTLVNYYCFVYGGQFYFNYVLLGRGKVTLKIKGVLQRSISEGHIQVQEQGSVWLQVEPLNITNITQLLSELTWYHNGSVIPPGGQDERITFSTDNRTLMIANFSSADAGVYKAQFNRISVQPYNQSCNDKLIPLLRSHPVLVPAVFCVNVNSCSALQVDQRVSLRRLGFNLSAGLSLVADGIANSREELEHLSLVWYRNGGGVSWSDFLDVVWRRYPTISQEFEIADSKVNYTDTGRYEVAMTVNLNEYLGDSESSCLALYNSQILVPFLNTYTSIYTLPLSWGFIDVTYYENLSFHLDIDKKAATRDDGATLICRASIDFPPFSMLSLIKNGQTVATSSSGQLETNSRNVNANTFGVYTCQLNASGEIFEESTFLKEQVSIKLVIAVDNTRVCDYSIESVEQALISKVSTECRCSFSQDDFSDSSIDCEDGGKLTYRSTIEYSNNEGSETASVIINRLTSQAPFSLMVDGMSVTVVAVDCDDCMSSLQSAGSPLSPAAASGLFIGGFATGALVVLIIVVVIVIIFMYKIRAKTEYHQSKAEDIDERNGDNDKTM